MPGLVKRGKTWHINKKVDGIRICESTGTDSLVEAERYLVHRLETIRQAAVYGIRPKRIFREAATKFFLENRHKKSIRSDKDNLIILDAYIGELTLESIHIGTLQPYIEAKRKSGVKSRTINFGLQIVRHILNLAASEWMDEYGLTWLAFAPKIKLLSESDARKPYPLDWTEQEKLFNFLPCHRMATNKVCEEQVHKPTLTLLRTATNMGSRAKVAQGLMVMRSCRASRKYLILSAYFLGRVGIEPTTN